ncbi:MAG: hypothetical protein ACRCVP_14570 [Shewanella xiamenensis]
MMNFCFRCSAKITKSTKFASSSGIVIYVCDCCLNAYNIYGDEQLLIVLYRIISDSNIEFCVGKERHFIYELKSNLKFLFPVYFDDALNKFKKDKDYSDFILNKLNLKRGCFNLDELRIALENVKPEVIRKEYDKMKRSTVDRFTSNQIGLGLESMIKSRKVYAVDVVKDEFTTLKKSKRSHILYTAGWRLNSEG